MTVPFNIIEELDAGKSIYRFSEPVVNLLALASGQEKQSIRETKIYPRSFRRYMPWYKTSNGGGAITLGNRKWSSITFTENFFSDDINIYKEKAYGCNARAWLRLSAHEVGHIKHAHKYGSLLLYLLTFLFQYMRFGHANAPLEKEADSGIKTYDNWSNFLDIHQLGNIETLLQSEQSNEDKIKTLNLWWDEYIKHSSPDHQ